MMVRTMKRPVWQCTLVGERIALFQTVAEAVVETNTPRSSLVLSIQGGLSHANGFKWVYAEIPVCEKDRTLLKVCRTCNEEKLAGEFTKSIKGADGYSVHCKVCAKVISQELHNTAESRKQHEKDNERCCTSCKVWKPFSEFFHDAKGKHGLMSRCKVCVNAYNKQWDKNKRETDAGFRMLSNLRRRMVIEVQKIKARGNDASKCDCSLNLLGEDIKTIKAHMEERFQEGMTWDNYGKWHVDHIRPCASFDLTIEENQRRCFHYTNLQPLWAIDNMRKAAKYVPDENE